MQSQHKKPSEVLHSLHQQIGSNDNCGGPESPPFSIRKYVLACRRKDIFHSWPFPEKYLQICLKQGINNVLPPLESHHSAIQSLRGDVHFNYCSQQNDENSGSCKKIVQISVGQEQMLKEECNLYSDEEISKGSSQDCHLSLSSNSYKHEEDGTNLSSGVASDIIVSRNQLHFRQRNKIMNGTKRLRNKRKRRKGKHKKRSMVDILSAAKPCTLEDLLRINRLCCGLSKPFENEIKRIEQMTDNSKSELTEEDSNEKLRTDDCEAADVDMLGGKRWFVKFKLNGCNPFPRT